MPDQTYIPQLSHRGRLRQVPIYLGKLLRSFVYEKDWKVLPMTAIVAGLVSMVVRRYYFVTMEGSLMGSFALVCVGIWNGCFNSIQSICRERGIVKREHRSGMHISSYIVAHMIYQAMLCLVQTGISLYICKITGVQFPTEGFITDYMMVDLGISLFLITYASDMLSLLVSAIVHSTTAAMTVMPFLLIFQLVFSGGFFSLPQWASSLSTLTISRYGLRSICALSDYNNRPMASSWNSIVKLKDKEIVYTPTIGQLCDALTNEENVAMKALRAKVVDNKSIYDSAVAILEKAIPGVVVPSFESLNFKETTTLGEIIDAFVSIPVIADNRNVVLDLHAKIGTIIDLIGEDAVKNAIQQKTAEASYNAAYERSEENIKNCWKWLIIFIFGYALIATVALEFIDKDKR